MLVAGRGRRRARARRAPRSRSASPSCVAEALDAPHELEPALAEDLAAFRLDTRPRRPARRRPPAPSPSAPAPPAPSSRGRRRHAASSRTAASTGVRTPQGRGAGGRGRRRRRPVELRARRPDGRLAAGRPVVGRQRRAAARAARRATRSRRPASRTSRPERRPRPAVQPRHPRRRLRARLDLPARAAGARPSSRPRCSSAARASSRAGRHPRRLGPRLRAPAEPDGRPLLGPLARHRGSVRGHRPRPVGRLARPRLGAPRRRRGPRPQPAAIPPELAARGF